MNLAKRLHGHLHTKNDLQSADAPFWVRNYDSLVRFVSLGRVEKLHRGTLDLADFRPNQAILDVGCGTGDLLLLAEKQVQGQGTFIGSDIEPSMIVQSRQKAIKCNSSATFIEGSIEAIAYIDETFDVITSSLMLHHLTNKQQEDGLLELNRLLKPGGKLVIVDINTARRSLVSRFPGHRHLAQQDSVQDHVPQQLRTAGFSAISTGEHSLRALSYAIGVKP